MSDGPRARPAPDPAGDRVAEGVRFVVAGIENRPGAQASARYAQTHPVPAGVALDLLLGGVRLLLDETAINLGADPEVVRRRWLDLLQTRTIADLEDRRG